MEQPCLTQHKFDRKYKTVISVKSTPSYMEMIEWINSNSNGSVEVWFNVPEEYGGNVIIDIAFENIDDALFFKIKYQYENTKRN